VRGGDIVSPSTKVGMLPRAVRLGEVETTLVPEGVGSAVVARVVIRAVDAEFDLGMMPLESARASVMSTGT
jgi:hypothetical protein